MPFSVFTLYFTYTQMQVDTVTLEKWLLPNLSKPENTLLQHRYIYIKDKGKKRYLRMSRYKRNKIKENWHGVPRPGEKPTGLQSLQTP